MTTYVSVCRNTVASNLKHGKNDPVIRVSRGRYGKPRRVHDFTSQGKVTIKYNPKNPMPWGARAWLEIET